MCLTGLSVAEYFRDKEGQDVLLFIDNIFRFTQAGSEVSALLGRIPSAVGYQPTLATDMGSMQEVFLWEFQFLYFLFSALPPQRRAQLHLCKQFTCQPMT